MTSQREKFLNKDIFKVGELVEDHATGELFQILDRGTNYITVATPAGPKKKWISEVSETEVKGIPDFIFENHSLSCFGFSSKWIDEVTASIIIEQFAEFDDLYIKHQIVKLIDECLDTTIDSDRRYSLIERLEAHYTKINQTLPFVLEAVKEELECLTVSNIFSEALDIREDTPRKTIQECVQKISEMDQSKKDILMPVVSIAETFGLVNEDVYDEIFDLLEENLDEIDLDIEDLEEAFEETDLTEEIIEPEVLLEVLSMAGRMSLGRNLRRREATIVVKRQRALSKAGTSSQLLGRARHLALTLIKRRMFRKPVDQMSRQEKERFELGASKRKALIARLAQKLVPRIRILQNQRLHGTAGPTGSSAGTAL